MRRREILALGACLTAAPGVALAQAAGRFQGQLQFADLGDPDGRLVRLLQPYAFVDRKGKTWSVPAGAIVDGASIPRVFWSVIGGPFEGRYRNASVIHDYYCDVRTEPWQDVHRMFHEGMLANNVEANKARLMFLAVYYGGPRWSEVVIRNMRIAQGAGVAYSKGPDSETVADMGDLSRLQTGLGIDLAVPERDGVAPAGTAADYTIIAVEQPRVDKTTFERLARITQERELSVEQIEALVEEARLGKPVGD